ncbi:hypothetical protein PanWU01x14_002990 [Parasponia andersonii]|uniref:Uncharacterized protein n=1 Tax=Parasponia andersonii TaxID=3476 RepID=A0A2P5E5C8_PARAD|nr:hypothetical protein PanWU01x14_002990 [Parasponia andersonii]
MVLKYRPQHNTDSKTTSRPQHLPSRSVSTSRQFPTLFPNIFPIGSVIPESGRLYIWTQNFIHRNSLRPGLSLSSNSFRASIALLKFHGSILRTRLFSISCLKANTNTSVAISCIERPFLIFQIFGMVSLKALRLYGFLTSSFPIRQTES